MTFIEFAAWLKDFLYDRTIYAVAGVEGAVIMLLAVMLIASWRSRLTEAKAERERERAQAERERLLAEKAEEKAEKNAAELRRLSEALTGLVQKTVRRAKYQSSASPIPFSPPPALKAVADGKDGEPR